MSALQFLLPHTRSLSSPSYGLRDTRAGRSLSYLLLCPVRFFFSFMGADTERDA